MAEAYIATGDGCVVVEAPTPRQARHLAVLIAWARVVDGDPEPELPCPADHHEREFFARMEAIEKRKEADG